MYEAAFGFLFIPVARQSTAGKTYDRPVLSTDIFATIHEAAGIAKVKT